LLSGVSVVVLSAALVIGVFASVDWLGNGSSVRAPEVLAAKIDRGDLDAGEATTTTGRHGLIASLTASTITKVSGSLVSVEGPWIMMPDPPTTVGSVTVASTSTTPGASTTSPRSGSTTNPPPTTTTTMSPITTTTTTVVVTTTEPVYTTTAEATTTTCGNNGNGQGNC
jgi:hypothetical protein